MQKQELAQSSGGSQEIAKASRGEDARRRAEEVMDKMTATVASAAEPLSSSASVLEAATQSLSDAAAAVAEASAAVADKALELGTAGVEMTTDAAKYAAQASVKAFTGLGLASAIEYLDDAIDQQAIKVAILDAAEAVGDRFDQVTGKQLVEMLEAKLRRQDEYNDILATRLDEALQRITALEQGQAK